MPQLRPIRYFDGKKMLWETDYDFLLRQKAALEQEIKCEERKIALCKETILKLKKKLEKVDKQMKILDTGCANFKDFVSLHDLGDSLQIERSRDQRLEDWEDEDDVGSEHSEGTEPGDLDGEVQVDHDDIEALLYPTFASIIYDNKLKIYKVTLCCTGMPLQFYVEKRCKSESETKVEDE